MNQTTKTLLPGGTIGILGGGQLGRMMALSAREMGYKIAVLDPAADAPCNPVADVPITGAYNDVQAVSELGKRSDLVTYEFENVSAEATATLMAQTNVPQGAALLATTQHRFREKSAIATLGIPTASFLSVNSSEELHAASNHLGFPFVLKTTMGGYDGKGQWVIRSNADLDSVWQSGPAQFVEGFPLEQNGPALIAESFVPFWKELSVVVARTPDGRVAAFPVAENIHEHHILHLSIVPARIPEDIQSQAAELAIRIAEGLEAVGLLAVEMFVTKDGKLYVNELAPRPHNSGHYTQDACLTSQFEQHVRAVCNLPLGATALHTAVVMVNILGQHVNPVLEQLPTWSENWKLHLYGKTESRENRKMGHVNVLCTDVEQALQQIRASGIWTSSYTQ